MRLLPLLLAALLPAAASAQTRVGVVPETGLGTTLSPAPSIGGSGAFSLDPSVLSPAALTPSLPAPSISPAAFAPALSAVSIPAAAKPEAPGSKIVPAALAAVSPAASTPQKPGSSSEQALQAGTALFDGAGKLSAAAIGDGPVSGSQSDPSRSSGLSPPTSEELVSAYREAKPGSKAIEAFGRNFVADAAQAVTSYTFMGDYFLGQLDQRRAPAQYQAAADLVALHDAREDAPSRKFMRLLGAWSAFQDHAQERMRTLMRMGRPMPKHLPPSPIAGGEYWDMAAGMNAQGFIHHELEPGVNYSFFDYSPYVTSYLETAAKIAGRTNVKVVEGDAVKISKPEKPIAVLRTKNAIHYVPGFGPKLEEMADWIAPGGQLVIQTDPKPGQRKMVIDGHGALIRRLLAQGWTIEYGFTGYAGRFANYALDTLVLTRPAAPAPRPAAEAAGLWKGYVDAVARVDADFNPLSFLFR